MAEDFTAQHMEQELADLKRQDQGNYECEVWSSTAEGAGNWKRCQKNPGHPSFIPFPEFTIEHLPEKYRNKKLFECIRYLGDLTVRLTVKYTSMDRPDGYVFSNFRGKRIIHTGSGCVRNAGMVLERRALKEACPCHVCEKSLEPKKEWWAVDVITAKHVIFCNEEVRNTIFEVFYDGDSDIQKRKVKQLYGVKVTNEDFDDDRSEVRCVTHDKTVADRLEYAFQLYLQLHRTLSKDRYAIFGRGNANLGIVISHPHGCSKHVTVGQWVDCIKGANSEVTASYGYIEYDSYLSYTYDMATCGGSSGGAVIIIGMWEEGWQSVLAIYYFCHTHMSGNVNDGPLNQSSMLQVTAKGGHTEEENGTLL